MRDCTQLRVRRQRLPAACAPPSVPGNSSCGEDNRQTGVWQISFSQIVCAHQMIYAKSFFEQICLNLSSAMALGVDIGLRLAVDGPVYRDKSLPPSYAFGTWSRRLNRFLLCSRHASSRAYVG